MFFYFRDIESIVASFYGDDKFVKVDCVFQLGLKYIVIMENLIFYV